MNILNERKAVKPKRGKDNSTKVIRIHTVREERKKTKSSVHRKNNLSERGIEESTGPKAINVHTRQEKDPSTQPRARGNEIVHQQDQNTT